MPPFRLNPFHDRILAALPVGEPVELHALREDADLMLHELVIYLEELVRAGYVTTAQEPDGHGGMRRLYTRLETPAVEREITYVREDE